MHNILSLNTLSFSLDCVGLHERINLRIWFNALLLFLFSQLLQFFCNMRSTVIRNSFYVVFVAVFVAKQKLDLSYDTIANSYLDLL